MNDVSKEQIGFNPEEYSLEEILKPRNCALIVVDIQKDFLDPKGKFAGWGRDISQMQSIVPNVQEMIDQAHKANIPVIFTQGSEDVKYRKRGPGLRRAVRWNEKDGDGSVNSERGTFGWEFYGVSLQEGDVVVEKHKWSAFDGVDKDDRSLQEILESKGIRTLVICGVVAETCVEQTIRDANNREYFVVVPRNSVGSNEPDQLISRMKYWDGGHVGDVLEEQEIKNIWTPQNSSAQT